MIEDLDLNELLFQYFLCDYLIGEIYQQVQDKGKQNTSSEVKQQCNWDQPEESAILYENGIYTFDDKRYQIIVTKNIEKVGRGSTPINFVNNRMRRILVNLLINDYSTRPDNEPVRKVIETKVLDYRSVDRRFSFDIGSATLGVQRDYRPNKNFVSELSDICNRINPGMTFSCQKTVGGES